MASITQTLSLRPSLLLHPQFRNPNRNSQSFNPRLNKTNFAIPKSAYLSISSKTPRLLPLAAATASATASATAAAASPPSETLSQSPFTESTRTVATIAILAFTVFKTLSLKLLQPILNPNPQFLNAVRASFHVAGPAFFAAARNPPPRVYLNTPLTVVAAGLSKWLDIYSGVLMVRVLLSWFPNIPWDRQPLSAIRDLCDPYLNLFRNIIPPVFDTLDVSPLLAFAVLGTLGSLLSSSRGL